ncbi:MAG: type II toxin-antitoxin system Phd/YefM family antitoxin [Actinomycetota bacterium]|nr:type II toxin-antitoxin system Phd/YefM family antitoxin [Actinomycetota bacterium]
MPLADVKNHLSEVVERLEREDGRVVITKHGPPRCRGPQHRRPRGTRGDAVGPVRPPAHA